jgi:hypothetical protein
MNRNLLKYAAGTQMFCPLCNVVLDAKRTVNIDAGKVKKTLCCKCWDNEVKHLISPATLARCDILDGRVLWSRKG